MVQPLGEHNIKLFSLNSNRDIAEKLSHQLVFHLENYLHASFQTVKSKSTLKNLSAVSMSTSSNQQAIRSIITCGNY